MNIETVRKTSIEEIVNWKIPDKEFLIMILRIHDD